jgi:hypothetical protein
VSNGQLSVGQRIRYITDLDAVLQHESSGTRSIEPNKHLIS